MFALNGLLDVFTTCPQSRDHSPSDYIKRVEEVSRWSDEAGCKGILVYTDNGIVDPWLVAQKILQCTRQLCPLVAVQPIYLHPYTVAKMAASFGYLHDRRICLNMLAGGFKGDLLALGDECPHDQRYQRTVEYSLVIRKLMESDQPITFEGSFYQIRGLRVMPALQTRLLPEFLISGSSEAGRAAAIAIGATAVEYPKPPSIAAEETVPPGLRRGMRFGLIARADAEEAWRLAWSRFPESRRGKLSHAIAMRTSDSVWHRQLSELGPALRKHDSPYWLWPFENYSTFCPYLVGDYDTVATEVAKYLHTGARTFILDIPLEPVDLESAEIVFSIGMQKAGLRAASAARAPIQLQSEEHCSPVRQQ